MYGRQLTHNENHNIMKNKIQECPNLHNEPTNSNSYGSESQLARKPPKTLRMR